MSQDDLADEVNISRSTISKWETGELLPDIRMLQKLSHCFKVSIDHLVGNSFFKKDILHEINRIYQTKDNAVNHRMLDIIDYLRQNTEMEKVIYELSQLTPNKRKQIEDIFISILKATIK